MFLDSLFGFYNTNYDFDNKDTRVTVSKKTTRIDKIFNVNLTCLYFRGFNFRDFQFTAVYNYILFSSPLVLLFYLDD